MIKTIALDYGKKYLINLEDSIVKVYDPVLKTTSNLPTPNITKSYSELCKHSVFRFKDDNVLVTIEMGVRSSHLYIVTHDVITGDTGILPKEKYLLSVENVYDFDVFFVKDNEDNYILRGENFFCITDELLSNLEQRKYKELVLFTNKLIRENMEYEKVVIAYINKLTELAFDKSNIITDDIYNY